MSDQRANYLELLQRAKTIEHEAFQIGLALLAVAPAEDLPWLLEITADENDHDVIYGDLILRELVSMPSGIE